MGNWRTDERTWREAPDRHCDLCGRLLTGRFWAVEVAGRELRLCDADCEVVYSDYWLPRYGSEARATS